MCLGNFWSAQEGFCRYQEFLKLPDAIWRANRTTDRSKRHGANDDHAKAKPQPLMFEGYRFLVRVQTYPRLGLDERTNRALVLVQPTLTSFDNVSETVATKSKHL